MNALSVGIDLGTTHSLIAVFEDNQLTLIPEASGKVLTPSAVSLGDDGRLLVGSSAYARRLSNPALTHTAFKRHMGSGKEFRLGKQIHSAPELSSMVLRKLRADFAAAYPGAAIGTLVISVPAYFSSAQREATMLAAELAGLPRPRLINEPTAAALAYGLNDRESERNFIVLDLGGGTFDVSIIEMFDGVMEVRASAGDAMLGGEDFTHAVARDIAHSFDTEWSGLSQDEQARVAAAAEAVKRHLSSAEKAEVSIALKEEERKYSLDRQRFEEACANLLIRMRRPIERCLYDAKLSVDEIDRAVLVGGATRMPMIRGLASRILRRLPESGLDPDEVVARGAAVQAALVQRNAALGDLVMTDVAPFSLGIASHIETPHGSIRGGFSPIIERNTTLPASREQLFYTLQDNQAELLVQVYQGEAPIAKENIPIGKISVHVPPARAGVESVRVRFSYDPSGLLHIRVTTVSTGEVKEMVIEGGASALGARERARRLKALEAYMVHPSTDSLNIALQERLKGLYAMFLGEDRHQVADLIARFEGVLDGQDPREIAHIRQELTEVADQLEKSYVR